MKDDGFFEPDWMRHILAKSVDRSEGNEPETLARHTWLVVKKVAELAHLRPELPTIAEVPDLWHLLYWSSFLHDFGKAAGGFQAQLRGISWERHRHEVLSLAFFDWISSHFAKNQQSWLIAAIASHHRDAKDIFEKYALDDVVEQAWSSFNHADIPLMWRWLAECGNAWIDLLDLAPFGVRPLTFNDAETAIQCVQGQGVTLIRTWLKYYYFLVNTELQKHRPSGLVALLMLRGLITTADHAASAHLSKFPDPIQQSWQSLADAILHGKYEPYHHQVLSAVAHGQSVLLIAPTGSGKTEAALYWALGDGSQAIPRIFYALPYQASMNAMFDRLRDEKTGFGEKAVGLQHGRTLQALYTRLLNAEEGINSRQANDKAKWESNINGLHARPLKVFSPYQMLKALFQIKGFEAMLTDYAQASFIFDEIHAYEPSRLALIVTLIKYLREKFAAKFFIMSATFPQIIREKLLVALDTTTVIQADRQLFKDFARHKLFLLDGELFSDENVSKIVQDFEDGKQVLVCANTVRRAQDIFDRLRSEGVPNSQIMLIHSRFIIRDRNKREDDVRKRTAFGLEQREPLILVATQVVEVSLNIDLDTIYTEPAPLEALLQRFGRVNRERKKGISPVHVFREPRDGQGIYGRHKEKELAGRIVQVTLAELEKHNQQIIDESQIDTWLNNIYADEILLNEWNTNYFDIAQKAESVINSLRPFNSDKTKEEDFEAMFDNVDVLPAEFEGDYLKCIENHEYIQSSQYFVGISQQKYAIFSKKGYIRKLDDDSLKYPRWIITLPYSDQRGLSFDINRPSEDDWS